MTDQMFDLVGDWPNPWILVRLLQVVGSPWEPGEDGFTHRDTGELGKVGMRTTPDPVLMQAMRDGVCPVKPSLDEELLAEAAEHKAVAGVWVDGAPSVANARTLVRVVAGIIDGGAVALRCRGSGLAHGADAFQAIAARLDDPDDEAEALVDALVHRQLGPTAQTTGMALLGLPDIALERDVGPDRAADVLTKAAVALIRDTGLEGLRAGGRNWSVAESPTHPGARLHLR
ncbi:MAG: hypothetical protein ACI8PZ_005266 [Myxococcota bacterium]|jgi:hypothetical protein